MKAKANFITNCLYCGIQFSRYHCPSEQEPKFCSQTCSNRYNAPFHKIDLHKTKSLFQANAKIVKNTVIITLTHEKEAIIDLEDCHLVNQYWWRATLLKNRWYVKTSIAYNKCIFIHNLIMNPSEGLVVDHINGNGLDNRRSNLRVCTNIENLRNRKKGHNNTSGYKGVTWQKTAGKWKAQIMLNRHNYHLGLYYSPVEAAKVYDAKALELHGEFANLSFPNEE